MKKKPAPEFYSPQSDYLLVNILSSLGMTVVMPEGDAAAEIEDGVFVYDIEDDAADEETQANTLNVKEKH